MADIDAPTSGVFCVFCVLMLTGYYLEVRKVSISPCSEPVKDLSYLPITKGWIG